MWAYRYSRWDGSQDVFPLSEDDLMAQLSDALLSHGDVDAALRAMTQRGVSSRDGEERLHGVQDLLQRLRQRREDLLARYDLDSLLERLERRLRDVVETERRGIQRRVQEARQGEGQAPTPGEGDEGGGVSDEDGDGLLGMLERLVARKLAFLDGLPSSPAEALQRLHDYEFLDAQARDLFQDLLQSLQQPMLDAHFRELSQRIGGLTLQDQERARQMLRDLNELLEERLRGGTPRLQEFLSRWGSVLGPGSSDSLDDLVDDLHRRFARMDALMNSLSSAQRQELRDLLRRAIRSEELLAEMERLEENLERMCPSSASHRGFRLYGEESVGLREALEVMGELQGVEELERQLRRTQQGGDLGAVDAALARRMLGDKGYDDLRRLRRLADVLEEAGYLRRAGQRYEMTPRGLRKIAQRALDEIFAHMRRGRHGGHSTERRGIGVELRQESRPYEYGVPFHLDLSRSIMNAVERSSGVPVRLRPEDFEVYAVEEQTRAATALMVDLSLSMAMRGNFLAAKKVALAMDNLIRTRFPQDTLYIVGFSTYAREVKAEHLAYLSWDEFDPYTNIQHGLEVSQRLLSRSGGSTKQIILISDGEPTAHMEGGQLFLQYPPSARTMRETLREVQRCTAQGITINIFMMDRSAYLVEFVNRISKLNRGRVFYTDPERLGQYILVDYCANRRRLVG